ncbi:MAG: polyprenyl diphosphate synthase [Caldiserica bacterium]|nr:polyprenyl diphosphate synthase [Caldisericota bacterium]MDH7562746.1 polyprenyl diphosphate synthase [Caldisericota bacterium]
MDSLIQEIKEEVSRGKLHLPRHVAIMLDGNGRWAKRRGLPRTEGHRAGGENVKRIVRFSGSIGISFLTLFGFSTENWNRPYQEVKNLLNLLEEYLITQREDLRENNVRLVSCGRIEEMPKRIQEALTQAMEFTSSCTGLTLNLAINYGGRAEMVDALKKAQEKIQSGELNPEEINPGLIDRFLYCPFLPRPELLIRTSGEQRLSNFLLWEVSQTFFWTTPTLWPDFSPEEFKEALRDWSDHYFPLPLRNGK